MVPSAPAAPVIAASHPERAPGRRKLPVTAAAPQTTTISATWATATGHRPLPAPAWLSPMNTSAKPAPATRPAATPAAGRPVVVAPRLGGTGVVDPGIGGARGGGFAEAQ